MKLSAVEWVKGLINKTQSQAYDGIITHIFPASVQVQLTGGQRTILTNVIIADHIDRRKLRAGSFCKVNHLLDRGDQSTGKFILTAILPIDLDDTVVAGESSRPGTPRIFVELDCSSEEWIISWSETRASLAYDLYSALDNSGTGVTRILQTTSLEISFPFVLGEGVFFSVEAVGSQGNSELSEWTTDIDYFTDTGIIAFGDDVIHGDVIGSANRFKIDATGVYRSENNGVSYPHNITPSSVFNDWGDTVNIDDIEFSQVISTTGLMFVFGKWENLSVEKQGWFWGSVDNGETWTDYSIRWNLETEGYPIWASLGDTDLFITVWLDGENILHKYPLSNITGGPTSEISLGVATLVQVEDKEKWAFPVWAASDEVYVAGRFNSPSDDAIAHIVKFDVGGPTWTDVIDDWDTDVCTALSVEENGTDRLFYATRETLI